MRVVSLFRLGRVPRPTSQHTRPKVLSGCPVLVRFWLGRGKFQDRILCRPRGDSNSFPTHPPLKRWAIIFRARGARIVPVSSGGPNPAGRKAGPSARTEVLGRDDKLSFAEAFAQDNSRTRCSRGLIVPTLFLLPTLEPAPRFRCRSP